MLWLLVLHLKSDVMKILVLTNSLGGLYSFRKEVILALTNAEHHIVISAPPHEKAQVFENMGCEIRLTQFKRRGTNPLSDFGQMLRYWKLIKEVKPEVVLSYTIKPNLYGGMACQLCGVPQIANITGLGSAVENPGWLQKLTIMLYKVGLRKTHTVFFQNKANKQFCEEHGMVKGNLKLIPGSGVNLEYHSFKEYPSAETSLRFIFISRLLKEKGIEEYFYAAEKIREKYYRTEFHIVGPCEDAYEDKLKELQQNGVVIYHGQQSDVRPFIANAHCTVHPSFYPEGMSNVLLESCAAGRPIITTDRPGCGEIVDDGVNGYVVRQQDGDDLVEKIERFIGLSFEEKKQMGLNARKKVEREFDRNIVVKAYLDAIAEIKA